jgi:putative nucleotidyltransferase with HDIG domain
LRKLVERNFKVDHAAQESGKISDEIRLKLLTSTANLITQSWFYDGVDRESLSNAKSVVQNTLNLVSDEPNILALLNFLQLGGDQLYAHSVAVSVYSCMMARMMGMTSQTTQIRLALGGLLHDIGKKELPLEVINKTRLEMSQQEFKLYESHTQRGKDILSQIPGIPEDVIQIAAHHHENNVGTGFPYGLGTQRIHPLAKIVAVADAFIMAAFKHNVQNKGLVIETLKNLATLHNMEYDQNSVRVLAKLFDIPFSSLTESAS